MAFVSLRIPSHSPGAFLTLTEHAMIDSAALRIAVRLAAAPSTSMRIRHLKSLVKVEAKIWLSAIRKVLISLLYIIDVKDAGWKIMMMDSVHYTLGLQSRRYPITMTRSLVPVQPRLQLPTSSTGRDLGDLRTLRELVAAVYLKYSEIAAVLRHLHASARYQETIFLVLYGQSRYVRKMLPT